MQEVKSRVAKGVLAMRYAAALKLLSRVLAGISLFNISRKLFNFGIYSVIQDFFAWYNDYFLFYISPITDSIKRALEYLLSVQMPIYFNDILVIYFIFGMANLRTLDVKEISFFLKPEIKNIKHQILLFTDLVFRVLLWPINVGLGPLMSLYDYFIITNLYNGAVSFSQVWRAAIDNWRRDLKNFLRETLYVFAVFIMFLLINTGLAYNQETLTRAASYILVTNNRRLSAPSGKFKSWRSRTGSEHRSCFPFAMNSSNRLPVIIPMLDRGMI